MSALISSVGPLISGGLGAIAKIDPKTVSKFGSTISGILSIFGGLSGQRAAGTEAGLQLEQAQLAQSEAAAEAQRIANQNRKFLRRQKLAFIKSGVTLEGSPLFVLETTLEEGQAEVDAEIRRGKARARLFTARAQQTIGAGRSSLLGTLFEGTSSVFNAFIAKS